MSITGSELTDLLRLAGIDEAIIAGVKPDVPLLLQGLDSVDFPTFIVAVEDRFAVSISEDAAWQLRSLDDFAELINRAPRGK
ncbi:acyl carrier protein [Desulfovibrio aerotolerans]|uniref:Acyl carrier protein n=1 Tax=Solidesulfovibrio aerotolerans TaxID=295255 RepID=A0A7C9IW14_9BACT|nr:acyl carrier protein [Solidesulfovibrio aerotolerans]MYL85320.1 acyl carrier protein [Solidesulfovibrio aerotolerans]